MTKFLKILLLTGIFSTQINAMDDEKSEKTIDFSKTFPTHVRISVNYKMNLADYPGKFIIVDETIKEDIGEVDKTKAGAERVSIHDAYPLKPAHFLDKAIKLGIRYDSDKGKGEVVPVHFYKEQSTSDIDLETCFLLSNLEGIRLNLMENLVISTAPVRATGYCRLGHETKPLMEYVGLPLAEINSFCNDDEIYNKILKTCGYSVPVQHPSSSGYAKIAKEKDFHKGQLLIINTYLAEAQEKHGVTLDKTDACQCNLFLNFFIYKGVVQTNERQKFAEELKLTIK
ncbi:MAG TPA: hypothetical protein VNJ29_02800 [Candidatus Nitrosotenuis sp.]|nr:hypothetical protein [Candidatus Nitrosotenuis sp.]